VAQLSGPTESTGGLRLTPPLVFQGYYEFQCGFFLCAAFYVALLVRDSAWMSGARGARLLICGFLVVALAGFGASLLTRSRNRIEKVVCQSRNFYGVLKILEEAVSSTEWHHVAMVHGHILHGLQFTHPVGATWPTLYYGPEGGGGLAVLALPKTSRRVGLVGLGIGTMAAYARTNDYFTFYEINPEVKRLALSNFTYLANCQGKVDYRLGDARLELEREASQQFDLLVLDAFSGDAVPVHLLTREAFAVYGRHLKTNGIIAVHISNQHLDLEPVLANAGTDRHYGVAVVESNPPPGQWWITRSKWVLLSPSPEVLNAASILKASRPPQPNASRVPLWTDDYSSLYPILL